MILRLYALPGLLQGLSATSMAFASPHNADQTVLSSPYAPELDNLADLARPAGNLPTLADLLTLESRASIFYSYARETDMSARFMNAVGEEEGTTVFVPTNKAVQALARKPHEDPEGNEVNSRDAEHADASQDNVQRWVGAHIIPASNVDFTSSEPYDTLTAGATITFSAIKTQRRPPYEPVIDPDSDAAHLGALKGKEFVRNTDAVQLKTVKECPHSDVPILKNTKYEHSKVDTDAAYLASVKGPTTPDHDAAHLSKVKGPFAQQPIWKQYELNDGVHIISMKQASNGVMFLIDGTVPV